MVSSFISSGCKRWLTSVLRVTFQAKEGKHPPPVPHVSGGGNENGKARHEVAYNATRDSAPLLMTFVLQRSSRKPGSTGHPSPAEQACALTSWLMRAPGSQDWWSEGSHTHRSDLQHTDEPHQAERHAQKS